MCLKSLHKHFWAGSKFIANTPDTDLQCKIVRGIVMDISFNCDKCGQPLAIDEAGAGQFVDCPKCSENLVVPSKSNSFATVNTPSPRPVQSPPSQQNQIMQCPSCGSSEHLLRASAAHEQGTSIVSGMTANIGALFTSHSVAPGLAGGVYGGVQQTNLAQRLAPPPNPKIRNDYTLILGIVIIIISLLLFQVALVVGASMFLVGLIAFVLGFFINAKCKRQYEAELLYHARAMQEWRHLWYCTKCGNTCRF